MAIYHCSAKIISRSSGRSATGAAAYRAGVDITDACTGVVAWSIGSCHKAPTWARERTAQWNAAKQAERRQDATVAREIARN